ncbi:hypothetical protein [Collimonas sp.]|jgi:hypothetical protein|uniref:hypothetical protein n=1 Tax=Collimonas sp. TaxID=1963772 RepID=UPI002C7CDB83|nr:hypothetical protein [Collimonas sp.]HWW08183.1 hypothetical protein [Collimonas sp.]
MSKFIEDGNFTLLVRGILCVIGVSLIFIGLKYDQTLMVSCIGLVIGAVGGISSRAAMLKIKPFDNTYKKAKKSYEKKDDQ